MATDVPDPHWLDPHRSISQGELAGMCSLSVAEIDELVEYGALTPVTAETPNATPLFSAACITPLREAMRLRGDYDLDLFTVSLLLGYLQRIEHLEHQLRALQGHAPHPQVLPREGPTPWREPHA
jgi:chaperone modulatory protein CbpM